MNSLNSDEDLASKCIGLCHALASQNKSFSFSLTVGSNFSFSLDTRELVSDNQTKKAKKKKSSPSPSTIRRSAKRREQFLKKKQAQARPPARNPSPALVPGPRLLPSPPPEGRRRVMSLGRRESPNLSFLNLDGLESDPSPPPPPPPPHPPEQDEIVDVGECKREDQYRPGILFCEIYAGRQPPAKVRSSISTLGTGKFVGIEEDGSFLYEFENGELYEF